ncbi:MAG: hypothetical protein AAFU80_12500 [Pseudomonadota bacterium]
MKTQTLTRTLIVGALGIGIALPGNAAPEAGLMKPAEGMPEALGPIAGLEVPREPALLEGALLAQQGEAARILRALVDLVDRDDDDRDDDDRYERDGRDRDDYDDDDDDDRDYDDRDDDDDDDDDDD